MAPFFMLNSFIDYLISEKRFSEHTAIAYKKDLEQFLEHIGIANQDEFGEVSSRVIRGWIVQLMDENYESTSVNRKISALRTFYRWMMKEGIVQENPMRLVRGPKMHKRLPVFIQKKELSKERLEEFTSEGFCGERDRLMLEVFYQTGIRASELINLKDKDVHSNSIKVLGKRNKERIIPISGELHQMILSYRKLRTEVNHPKDDTLFVLENGKRMYPKFVYRKIKSFLEQISDVKKKSPHVLRHTFATHMLNNGAGLEVLKEILGHANLSATQVYTHNSFAEISSIYAKSHPRG